MAQEPLTNSQPWPPLHVPAREIPVPAHLSPQAQAFLASPQFPSTPYPPLDDAAAWRALVKASDDGLAPKLAALTQSFAAEIEDRTVDGVQVYVVTPAGVRADDPAILLDIHGGGFILGGGRTCRTMAKTTACRFGVRVWSIDYRMPPDHPYPAALDDCLAVYRVLLRQRPADQIVVHGGSAGGNLAAALILRARDEGLPLPAGAVLHTPALDLTQSGDSFRANMGVDTVLTQNLEPSHRLYAAGHDLRHPYLSPLYGDLSKGFPPTLLATGTRDLLLSDSVRMHRALRAAGVAAELHVQEAEPHGGFLIANAPEGAAMDLEMRGFANRIWRRASPPEPAQGARS